MSFDNERYQRHMADCERRDRADDAVTDEMVGEYIREELLDEMSVELADSRDGKELAGYCARCTPKTFKKARWALVERELEAQR